MSSRWAHVLGLVTGLALVGCASEGPTTINLQPNPGEGEGEGEGEGGATGSSTGTGTPPPSGSAQDYFENNVYPELAASCGSCHNKSTQGVGTPYFLDATPTASYDLLMTLPGYVIEPANSRLILKPEHYGGDAPALTVDQKDLVTAWLEQELTMNPDGGGGEVQLTPLQELQKFGSCMSYADMEIFNIAELANQTVIYQNNPVECDSCHDSNNGATGLAGTAITPVMDRMFLLTQQMPWIMKFATVTLNEDGTFKDIVRANRWVEKCVEEQLIGNPHPPCVGGTLDANIISDINGLYDATYARYAADECDLAVGPPGAEQP